MPCEGRVCKESAVYPFQRCRAILMGCRRQLVADGRLVLGIIGIQRPEEQMTDAQLLAMVTRQAIFEDDADPLLAVGGDEVEFRDAITGQPLDPALVRAARREELEYFAAKPVWRKVPRAEATRRLGKPQISVKWVDVNKGDDDSPN